MLTNLAGRVGIVTGGGSGIGKAVSIALAQAGANVAILDRNLEAARETSIHINTRLNAAGRGGTSIPIEVDITNLDNVKDAVKQAQNSLEGVLSHAVNCAGITADGFMFKMTEDQWDKVIDVNLKGTFFVTQAVSQAIMAENNTEVGGSIVNLSSIIGKVGNLGQANYAASKGGVILFSKTAAKELARHNIRVNAVLPGFIDTPMAQAVPQKVLDKMITQIPLGRLGKPEEVADLCTFLCSDRSSFITGAAIEVTGGQFM